MIWIALWLAFTSGAFLAATPVEYLAAMTNSQLLGWRLTATICILSGCGAVYVAAVT